MARKRESDQKRHLLKRLRRLFGVASAFTLALGVLAFAWHWRATVPLKDVHVSGARHATVEEIKELARVDSVETLYAVRPELVADRVGRHAWVASVDVRRIPTGSLRLRVTEREPVAVVVDSRGRPAWYLDAFGFSMPLAEGAVYDVPLLYGLRSPYNPRQPIESRPAIEFLAAFAAAGDEVNALVSEVHVGGGGDITVYTIPVDARGAVPVRMGRSNFASRLVRLRGFWDQAVLTRKDRKFALVDLRFENQIVTREEPWPN